LYQDITAGIGMRR